MAVSRRTLHFETCISFCRHAQYWTSRTWAVLAQLAVRRDGTDVAVFRLAAHEDLVEEEFG